MAEIVGTIDALVMPNIEDGQRRYQIKVDDKKVYVLIPAQYVLKHGQQIIVKNRESGPTNCYFTVYAERKDMEKLIVEYEGTSAKDYPGQDWLNLRGN